MFKDLFYLAPTIFMSDIIDIGWTNNPMKDETGYLTHDQIKKIIVSADNVRDQVFLITLAYTCRRVSEIVRSLRPTDIKWEENMINWNILKKNPRKRLDNGLLEPKKESIRRLLPVKKIVIDTLKRYVGQNQIRDNDFIFPFNRSRAFQIIRKSGKLAGIEYVGSKRLHPHHFRHSFIREGAIRAETPKDIVLLSEQAQHGKIQTTMQYLRYAPQDQRELLKRMFEEDS